MAEYAQYAEAASYIAAAIAIGIGTIGPALGQGMVASRACENVGKYPDSAPTIRLLMFAALGFIETSSIYAFLIAGALIFFSG